MIKVDALGNVEIKQRPRLLTAATATDSAGSSTAAASASGKASLQNRTVAVARKDQVVPVTCFCLCCTSLWARAAHWASSVLFNPWFERLSLGITLLACINLAMAEPSVDVCEQIPANLPGSCWALSQYLLTSEIVIIVFFSIEVLMNILVFAWSYPYDAVRLLDFCVTISTIISITATISSVRITRIIRTLRSLRPLRLVNYFPRLKLVFDAILVALPKIRDVILVIFLFAYIFAVAGMENFKGIMSYCNDATMPNKTACMGDGKDLLFYNATGIDCYQMPTYAEQNACFANGALGSPFQRVWLSRPENFDTLGNSLLTVFELASGENWPVFSSFALDGVGLNEAQSRDAFPAALVYYIIITIFLNMFLIELFAKSIVESYNGLRDEHSGFSLLTQEQRVWVRNLKILMVLRLPRPPPPTPLLNPWLQPINSLRSIAYILRTSRTWTRGVAANTLIYILFLCSQHANQTASWTDAQTYGGRITSLLFLVEISTNLLAFGARATFRSWWFILDLILVPCAIAGSFITFGIAGPVLRIVGSLRLLNVLRLSQTMQRLLNALIFTSPVLANVGVFLLLAFFIFAIIGMNAFSGIKHDLTPGPFNDDYNFDSFGGSFMFLMISATGENFDVAMHYLSISTPFCFPGDDITKSNCGLSLSVMACYWVSFYTIVNFTLINLVSAVVLEAFEEMSESSSSQVGAHANLSPAIADRFAKLWQHEDKLATLTLPVEGVVKIVSRLPYPLGVHGSPALLALTKVRQGESAVRGTLKAKRDQHAKVSNVFKIAAVQSANVSVLLPTSARSGGVLRSPSRSSVRSSFLGVSKSASVIVERASANHVNTPAWQKSSRYSSKDITNALALELARPIVKKLSCVPDKHNRLRFNEVLTALLDQAGGRSPLLSTIDGGHGESGSNVSMKQDEAARIVISTWRAYMRLKERRAAAAAAVATLE